MENDGILGFQFEPIKALQPDSSSDKKLDLQQIVNQALLGETKHQLILGACCFNCNQMSTTREYLCCHELNAYNKVCIFIYSQFCKFTATLIRQYV